MKWSRSSLVLTLSLCLLSSASAQRQMEHLNRGVVAMRTSSTQVYVGWRLLGNDPEDVGFNLYRIRGGVTNKLNGTPITASCNFTDTPPNFSVANEYFVTAVIGGVEQPADSSCVLPASAPTRQYLSIPLTPPPGGTAYDGVPYTYGANDCSAADVDGDGEYEIVLKWDPSNSHDNSQGGFTGNTWLDCYKLDGTRLWRLDLGPNMRSGAHYMDFMVFDFDGDGKAELMCRTAPGSKDGMGNYVGSAAKWQTANGPRPSFNNTDDYRFSNPNPNTTNGYVLAGPEFLTVFNGETGEEMATATYYPKRDQDNNNDNPTASRINAIWGDSYGNRLDRFLAGVAYCDGIRPSAIFCRGYYTRAFLVAWDWRNGQLTRRWVFDSNDGTPGNTAYRGQGAHSLSIGDLDGDGKDEVTYGACAIDHDGTGLYSTGLGHGDAEHMSDMDPYRDGMEIWFVHECPSCYGPHGLEMHDAGTGNLIFSLDGQNSDVGRGVAIDIDPRYPGYEMWGSRPNPTVLMNATGVEVPTSRPGSMNFACWWDSDTLREILDGTSISKWDWNSGGSASSILSPGGLSSNNGTKSTPALSADLFGDWREEVIWRTSGNNELRIYTTTIPATNRIYTLMHDPQYRVAIAWQNTGYNQPPHPSFNIGPQMYPPPLAPTSDARIAWHGGGGGNAWDVAATSNWYVNGVWTNDVPTNFTQGSTVLFDARGESNPAVNIVGAPTPGEVRVFSGGDHIFTGAGSISGTCELIKAGAGRLTINNTNAYSGATVVSGGELIVNGSLDSSPVLVEARGEPHGHGRIGGAGRLSQGLTVQDRCGVVVGAGRYVAGTLTVLNGMTEMGNVLNEFDLSNDPTGTTNANDRINVTGDLNLSGNNVIEITQLSSYLGGGVYPLITYSGSLSGGLGNLSLVGNFLQPVALTNPPGMIGLIAVLPTAPPTDPSGLSATAVSPYQINLAWNDNSNDEMTFVVQRSLNNVSFSNIASLPPDSTDYSDLGLLASTTYYYRVVATNLAGVSGFSADSATTFTPAASLTWVGDGIDNDWDLGISQNWSDGGGSSAYGDGVGVLFDNSGDNNPAINLVELLQPDSVVVNAGQNYTFSGVGSLGGSMDLLKSGSGSLTINNDNSFSGGVTLNSGTLNLANGSAAGTGPLTINGGTLTLSGSGGPATYGNTLLFNSAATITSSGSGNNNQALSGTWVGSSPVNIQTGSGGTFSLRGNLGGYSGSVTLTSSGTLRFWDSVGSGSTAFDLGTASATMVNRNGSVTIALGALSGGVNTTLSGRSSSSGGSGSTYQIGGKDLNTTFAGTIQDGNDTVSIEKIGAGTLTLTGNNSYTGGTVVNEGALLVNGSNFGAGDVTVAEGAILGGIGFVGGNTFVNGILSPGASIGTLTFAADLALTTNSTCVFEISKVPLAGDEVDVFGNLVLAGELTVVNTGVEPLEEGDSFDLIDAANVIGEFDSYNLPALDSGLAWNTSTVSSNGIISVVSISQPVFAGLSLTGNGLVASGTGGAAGATYYVLTSTNVALPFELWTRLLTNQFEGDGGFSVTNPVSSGTGPRFYSIEVP